MPIDTDRDNKSNCIAFQTIYRTIRSVCSVLMYNHMSKKSCPYYVGTGFIKMDKTCWTYGVYMNYEAIEKVLVKLPNIYLLASCHTLVRSVV